MIIERYVINDPRLETMGRLFEIKTPNIERKIISDTYTTRKRIRKRKRVPAPKR